MDGGNLAEFGGKGVRGGESGIVCVSKSLVMVLANLVQI